MKTLERQANNGFTLVELLVVIAIIATLLSILMPSLNLARNQARLLTDSANAKQIGTLTATYRASNNNYVPMVGNRFSKTAGTSLLSVAFRDYIGGLTKLPDDLSPDKDWHTLNNKVLKYNDKYLPNFFSCPFGRGKAASGKPMALNKTVKIGSTTFPLLSMGDGKFDSYQVSGDAGRETSTGSGLFYGSKGMRYMAHPWGMPHGTLKYALLPWNADVIKNLIPESEIKNEGRVVKYPTKWSGTELKKVRACGESDAIVAWCSLGEFMDWYGIFNYKSHMKKKIGGTTALFADTHVEWVPGTQIGWN